MPGKITKNLRKGHLSEDIGVSFLRNFSAVAQVRQEDDIGIDAVATLLKPNGKFLYAEESFTVQIKSASIKKINYDEQQLDWLMEQDLPFFVMIVDKEEGEIKMYTTNPIFGLFTHDTNTATLILDEEPNHPHQRITTNDRHSDIILGPPILIASERDARTDELIEKIYSLLKNWISSEISQIGFRKLKHSRLAEWETWGNPKYSGAISSTSSSNLSQDMEIIKPYVEYLAGHVFWSPPKHKAASAFLMLKEWYEENDVDLDIDEEIFENRIP